MDAAGRNKPHYETVSLADDPEDLMSGTEVDESLMGDEKLWGQQRRRPHDAHNRTGILATLKECRWFIDTVLLLVIIGLLVVIYYQPAAERLATNARQIGGDYTGGGPQFTTKIVKWEADASFAPENATDFFSNATLARWNSIMPTGTGRALSNNTFFTTTMTHELHCIFMMARIFHGITTSNYAAIPHDYHSHFMHCVDYLRQGAMCAGDLAMEAHDEKDADDFGPMDGGWNAHHVCKDYDEVIGYLDGQIKDGIRVVLAIDD